MSYELLIDIILLLLAALKREHDTLGKKLKTVEAAVKGLEQEMDDFQEEKQVRLTRMTGSSRSAYTWCGVHTKLLFAFYSKTELQRSDACFEA
jgi:ParB-like chromosome segregation protein Spo0J